MDIEREALEKGNISSEDGWINHIHSKSYHARFTYVYKNNHNTIKGFICIRPFVNNDEVRKFSELYNYNVNNMGNLISEVYILPKFRGQGIDKDLYEFAINNMYTLSALYSEVDTANRGAQEFQTKMGLNKVGHTSDYNTDETKSVWKLFEIQNQPNVLTFK